MNRLRSLLLAVIVTSSFAFATDAHAAFTVVAKEEASKAFDFEVNCRTVHPASLSLPSEAENVRVLEPAVGDVLRDGFGDYELARVETVTTRTVDDHQVVDVTVVGSGRACEQPTLPNAWETESIAIRAAYEVTRQPKVQFSTEHGGTNPVVAPRKVAADADAGWTNLRWKNWGEKTATAKGLFYGQIFYPNGWDGPPEVTRRVPVTITLTKIAQCGKRWMYSHWQTKFGRGVDPKLERQARIPPSADCIKSHR